MHYSVSCCSSFTDFDEQTADDWDVDMSVYYDQGRSSWLDNYDCFDLSPTQLQTDNTWVLLTWHQTQCITVSVSPQMAATWTPEITCACALKGDFGRVWTGCRDANKKSATLRDLQRFGCFYNPLLNNSQVLSAPI